MSSMASFTSLRTPRLLTVFLLPVMILATALAQAPLQAQDVTDLIRRLDSETFAERQEATQELRKMGVTVFPELVEAMAEGGPELSNRVVGILRSHLNSDDAEIAKAAKAALKKIAAGKNKFAAELASKNLKPQFDAPNPKNGVGPGQIQIQVQAVAGQRQSVRARITNGITEIEAQENGRRVKILETPDQGITVEVTEKQDGKELTTKNTARDVKELKKKYPRAHELYRKYAMQNGEQPAFQFGIVPGGPVRLPAGLPDRGRFAKRHQAMQLEHARRLLGVLTNHVTDLSRNTEEKSKLNKVLEDLRAAEEHLRDAEKSLKNQPDD